MRELLTASTVLTREDDISVWRVFRGSAPADVADGEVLFGLRKFGLSANNLSYALYGKAMGYWRFFPSAEAGWSCTPAWGFAEVLNSKVDGISPGERVFGCFPISTHCRFKPRRTNAGGFCDLAAHRQILSAIYSEYERCTSDGDDRFESWLAVFRPLFLTAYMMSEYLAGHGFFSARRAVISSASSKTACATAFCLSDAPLERIGVTSARNLDFARRTGLYDVVVTYDDLDSIPAAGSMVYVDFSGDALLRQGIHARFGSQVLHDCFAGATHRRTVEDAAGQRVATPALFFAPDQLRASRQHLGAAELRRRLELKQRAFFETLEDRGMSALRQSEGLQSACAVLAELHSGLRSPHGADIVTLDG